MTLEEKTTPLWESSRELAAGQAAFRTLADWSHEDAEHNVVQRSTDAPQQGVSGRSWAPSKAERRLRVDEVGHGGLASFTEPVH